MSAINVNSITGRTGLHGPVLTGVSTAADGFQVLAGEFKVNGISTFVGMSTFNGGIDVAGGGLKIVGDLNGANITGILTVTAPSTGTGATIFINAPAHNSSVASKADLRFGYNHSGSPDAVGYIRLEEESVNSFGGTLKFATPANNGSGGSSTSEHLYLTASGRLGIGTAHPLTPLHIFNSGVNYVIIETGEADFNPMIEYKNADRRWRAGLFGDYADGFVIRDITAGGDNRLTIDTNGNVGIMEDNPDVRLHVKETIDVAYSPDNATNGVNNILKLENPSTTANAFAGIAFRTGNGADMYFGSIQQTTNAGDFYFANQNTTNVELMRVKSTGQVLIGTQSPIDTGNATAKLQVVADVGGGGATPNSGNALVLGQRTNGADKAGVAFGLAADNGGESTNACTLDIFTATSGSLSKRMSINSGGDVDIVNGNLVFETSGKGIDFSATSGSGTSELFDDYEEGSGTPTVSFQTSGSLTLGSSQTFKYVKIGDLVTFSFEFQVASTTNPSGAIKIDLPFSSGTGVYSAGAVRLYGVTFTGSPYLEISPSLSYVLVQSSVSGTVTSPINGTGYYFGTISYRTTG
jgi:hypothetical protein